MTSKNSKGKNKTNKTIKALKNIYFKTNHPAGFGGETKLTKAVKKSINKHKVSEWLQSTDTYTLHKPAKKKFPRRSYIVGGINSLWQLDLSDLSKLSQYNDSYKWLLVAIDVFSKKAYVKAIKNKSGSVVAKALDELLNNTKPRVEKVMTDKGTEFYNHHVKSVLKQHNVLGHYSSNNQEIKASVVERFQKTLKAKIYRYFTYTGGYRYIDQLDKFVEGYNNTKHSAHGKSPNAINSMNEEEIWQKLYVNDDTIAHKVKPKFLKGEYVRISKYATTFAKGYLPRWSDEIFQISRVQTTNPPVYSLQDEAGDELEGTFYGPELQRVINTNKAFKIDEIIGQRKVNGKIQYLVRWKGYPPSFDSYVDKNKIISNYKN